MSKDRNDALRNSVVSILRSVFDRNVQGSAFNEWVWRHRLTSRRLSLVLKSYVTLDMVEEIQRYCREQVDTLWDEVKRFENPHNYYVDLSQRLWDIKQELLRRNR